MLKTVGNYRWNHAAKFGAVLLTSALSLVLDTTVSASSSVNFHPGCQVVFASQQEAAELLGRSDIYTRSMSEYDRQSRMKSANKVDESTFRQFAASQAEGWAQDEVRKLTSILEKLRERLKSLRLRLPARVLLIKTSGLEEGNAPYCRSPAIVLPAGKLRLDQGPLLRLLAHELFHLLSSGNPELQDELYKIVGFHRCDRIQLPPTVRNRRITNPDAPIIRHYIQLDIEGQSVTAVPVLFASVARYEEGQGNFFKYLQFRLLQISNREGSWEPTLESGKPKYFDPRATPSFLKQIGKNTSYIIHPEEILAENFVELVMETPNLKSPEIVEDMRAILSANPAALPPQR